MNPDIRWKQRFGSFDRDLALLAEASKDATKLSVLEKEGLTSRFQYTLELAWKTLKDFLEDGGMVISPVTPRQVVKDAFAATILPDGQVWIDMLNSRNLLAHTYDPEVFEEVVIAISARYLPALTFLHDYLAAKLPE